MSKTLTLYELAKNQAAHITGFQTQDEESEIRLREIGFAEGDSVQALHFGLFGRNPMTVSLNGALIALRKADALIITVEIINE